MKNKPDMEAKEENISLMESMLVSDASRSVMSWLILQPVGRR